MTVSCAKNSFLSALAFALIAALPSVASADPTCPVGEGQDHLTIHQVMIDFGHYTMNASDLALKDVTPEKVVTDAEIAAVISDLGVARACAKAVLDNPTGDLLPDGASQVSGDQLKKLLSDLQSFMTEFYDELGDFADDFRTLLAAKADARNFDAVYKDSQDLDALVTKAHRELSFDSDPRPR